MRRLLHVVALLSMVGSVHVDAHPVTRSPEGVEQLAHGLLDGLVRLDTTHAIGSARAAEFLAARFRAEGFPASDIYVGGPRPDKMNVVVRLRGSEGARAVLFNAHLDVVEAVRSTWSVEPFALTEKDGFYYGRGTVDVKGEVAIIAANLIRLHREGYRPRRDIIAFFNVDEEAGGDANGVEWMLKEHRDLIDAALVINHDAGKGHMLGGQRIWNTIQTAEKAYATYSISVTGTGGHSSLPPRDNAIARLARAVARVDAYSFPVRLSETTRDYLGALTDRVSPSEADAIHRLLRDPADAAALDVLRDDPVVNAQIHSTCPVTLIEGGQSESALPMHAKATIQCRLLPDEEEGTVLSALTRAVDDPGVVVAVEYPLAASPPQPMDPVVLAAVERVTESMWPGVSVVPAMSSGASDNVYFRRAGLPTFGVSGMFVDDGDLRAHGRDERVGVTAFYESLEFSYRLMQALAPP